MGTRLRAMSAFQSCGLTCLVFLVSVTFTVMIAARTQAAEPGWVGPIDVVASTDRKMLYVVEADGSQVAVVDIASRKVVRKIACPARPTGMALSPDGATIYLTCGGADGKVCVVEASTGKITKTIAVGHTPTAPTLLADGKRLAVCNRFNHDVSIIDLATSEELARVAVLREPVSSAVTPDGTLLFVANLLPVDPADADNVAAEVSVIDTGDLKTSTIRLPNGSSSVYGVTVSPDGQYAYVVHILSRYQMPTTQLERGWMNTNALSIIDVAGKKLLNTVLLDDLDRGAANPWGVTTTDDGKTILVTHAGTHELSVIDAEGLIEKLDRIAKKDETPKDDQANTYGTGYTTTFEGVPNDLTFLVDLRRRIKLQRGTALDVIRGRGVKIAGPRGLDVIGSKVYIAAYFSDVIAEVDLNDKSYVPVSTIPLGPEPIMTVQRRGELYFHDADFCFQHWQSCSSCHPGVRVDGLNWDLMNDGMGNPKNVKSMLLALETPPAMSSGIRDTGEEAVRAGLKHIQFAVRPEEDAVAIDEFLKALKPAPSPHLVNGKLGEPAKRGKLLFFSDRVGCSECHPEPYYTDLAMHDVGHKGKYSRRSTFDTPSLIEAWRTAPYLHDGHFTTVQQLLKQGKHGLSPEAADSMTQQELDDLAEFVLSL